MKAALEKIEPGFGSSFALRKFERAGDGEHSKPHWHFHPEYEIVYISKGKGKRHIGNHISFYEGGDLIFLGPNLPHYGFSSGLNQKHYEVVVQMKADFLGEHFLNKPEMFAIKQLFERSKTGLTFYGNIKKEVGKRLYRMCQMEQFQKLMELLSILNSMAHTEEVNKLNIKSLSIEVSAQDRDRMDIIYSYVQEHYREQITLAQIAKEVNMTEPAFCRYFKKLTNVTFTNFVNEFRITQACQLLQEDNRTIATICHECGFNNLSHFNKAFKNVTQLSPSAYRKSLKEVLS